MAFYDSSGGNGPWSGLGGSGVGGDGPGMPDLEGLLRRFGANARRTALRVAARVGGGDPLLHVGLSGPTRRGGCRHALRPLLAGDGSGAPLHRAVPRDRDQGSGGTPAQGRVRFPHRRGRRPHCLRRAAVPRGVAHAHRGSERRGGRMDRAVQGAGPKGLPLQRPRHPLDLPGHERGRHAGRRRRPQRGRGADRRPRADRRPGQGPPPGDERPLRDRDQRPATRPPGRESTGRGQAVLQRGQRGDPGKGTPHQRGARRIQPGDPPRPRRRRASHPGGRGLRGGAGEPGARRGVTVRSRVR